MTLSSPPEPEPLYELPGDIELARVVTFIQVVILFGLGTTVGTLGSIGTWSIRILQLFTDVEAPQLQEFAHIVQISGWTLVGIAFLLGVVTWGVGQGKRWAQVLMVAVQAIIVAAAVAGTVLVGTFAFGFFAVLLFGLPSLWAGVSLLTGSANQWFRQRGWEPWYERYYSRNGRRRR